MKTFTMLSVAGALTFAVPALAADEPSSTPTPSAEQQCRTERTGMGKDAFALLYGTNKNRSNAFGKCVSKRAKSTDSAAATAHTNASKECDAEEAADAAAFKAKYGTGKKGANAHGKCVSQKAKAKTDEAVSAAVKSDVNAAKTCKKARKDDKAAFDAKWGTKKNAFGKCVSATAKAKS